jgi:hypothetical protein
MDELKIVKQSEIHAIIRPWVTERLASDHFEETGTLKWVRSVDAPIRQVFFFAQWKGGNVAPRWGVSLDFVPHISGGKIRWHRTAKSAMCDLNVDARDPALDLSCMYGTRPIENRAAQVVLESVRRARDFWDRARRISDLPQAIDWLRTYLSGPGLGFDNYVQHPLAGAFACAMNHQPAKAVTELEHFIERTPLHHDVAEKLRQLLRDITTQGVDRPAAGSS